MVPGSNPVMKQRHMGLALLVCNGAAMGVFMRVEAINTASTASKVALDKEHYPTACSDTPSLLARLTALCPSFVWSALSPDLSFPDKFLQTCSCLLYTLLRRHNACYLAFCPGLSGHPEHSWLCAPGRLRQLGFVLRQVRLLHRE